MEAAAGDGEEELDRITVVTKVSFPIEFDFEAEAYTRPLLSSV